MHVLAAEKKIPYIWPDLSCLSSRKAEYKSMYGLYQDSPIRWLHLPSWHEEQFRSGHCSPIHEQEVFTKLIWNHTAAL